MSDLHQLFAISWHTGWGALLATLIRVVLVLLPAMVLMAVYGWMERRQMAFMQDRIGPTRADLRLGRLRITAWGLLHILADALKAAFKEDLVPKQANRLLFGLAPILALVPVFVVFVVIPVGGYFAVEHWDKVLTAGEVAAHTRAGDAFRLQGIQLEIGLLLVFAFSGLGVFSASLAGFGSHNKWALLAGIRAAAQMISYEVTLGLSAVGALLLYGSLEPMAIVQWQGPHLGRWGVLIQPIGAVVFLTAAIAEAKRLPFDIPEGESEIFGFHLEYSGMRWVFYLLSEYLEVAFVGALFTTLFLGGWQVPGLHADGFHIGGLSLALPHLAVVLLQMGAFWAKVVLMGFLIIAIRWTLPRMRYDQLMRLGWLGLLPVSLANVVATAILLLVFSRYGWTLDHFWVAALLLALVTMALVMLVRPRRVNDDPAAPSPSRQV